jgi:hypothetical protein
VMRAYCLCLDLYVLAELFNPPSKDHLRMCRSNTVATNLKRVASRNAQGKGSSISKRLTRPSTKTTECLPLRDQVPNFASICEDCA